MGKVTAAPHAAGSPHMLSGLLGPYQAALKRRRGPQLALRIKHCRSSLWPLEAVVSDRLALAKLGAVARLETVVIAEVRSSYPV